MSVEQELRDRGFRPTHGVFARRESDEILHEVEFDRFRHHGQRVVKVGVGVRHPPTERTLVSLHRTIGVSTMGWSPAGGWVFGRELGMVPQASLTFTSPVRHWLGDVSSIAQALDVIAGVRTLRDLRGFYLAPAATHWRPPFFTSCLRQMIVIEMERQRSGAPPRAAELQILETGWRRPEPHYRPVVARWSVEAMWPLVARAVAG